ncbi:MAG: glycyl-radical enzyme activating protein [bacterium]|nr:glycyl-radical enzyme activating protein [bacterium]
MDATAGEAARGLIFDVQRYSVHDGPGIRTTVFLKGCLLRCAWCQNPESLRPHPEVAFYADRCRELGQCLAVCPRDALQPDTERVVRDRCDACELCAAACPHGAFEVVGRRVAANELVEEVQRDRAFFEASGGGVTLSGGEPTLQMAFVGAFARLCRDLGLRVGLQTCGAFGWAALEPLLSDFEFVHFDLKIMDPQDHRRWTGADNRSILENARRLAAGEWPVEFRMPVIPGRTDSLSNLESVAAFLHELRVERIRLLAYHRLGEAKLPRLGYPIPPLGSAPEPNGKTQLEAAREHLRGLGLEVLT